MSDLKKLSLNIFEPRCWLAVAFIFSLIAHNTHILTLLGLILWLPVIGKMYRKRSFPVGYLLEPEIKLILVFLLYALFSLFWSPLDQTLISKEIARIFVSAALVCVFLYPDENKKTTYYSVDSLLVLGGPLVMLLLLLAPIYYIFQNGLPDDPDIYRTLMVRSGLLYHYETVAWFSGLVYLLMSSKFINLLLLQHRNGFDNFLVVTFPVLIVVVLVALTLCQSGATFLGVGMGLLCVFFTIDLKRKFLALGVLIASALIVILCGWALEIPVGRVMLETTDVDRTLVWRQAISLILEAQFFGHGFGANSVIDSLESTSYSAMHFHNVYLAILYYGGVFGLIIFLLLIFSVVKNNFRYGREQGWLPVFLMALTIFFFDGNHVITYLSSELYIFILPILMLVSQRRVASNSNA